MKIDIHSHVQRIDGRHQVKELLEDMMKNRIDLRVVSTFQGPSIQWCNKFISDLVETNKKLIGCAVINPKLDSAVEDTIHAVSLKNIRIIEFNSFEHGYYPDDCENLEAVLSIIEKEGLPVKVFTGIGSRSLPHQWEIHTKNHPNMNFIFLHIGCFDYGYSCVDIATRNDNIYVETSNQYEMQILRKTFQELRDNKILFGSMYPERLTSNGIDIFDMFELDDDIIKNIMYLNSKKLLKI